MKILNQEAVRKEGERIFSVTLGKLKVKPASFWNRLKWKILGEGSALLAIRHDYEVIKELNAELHGLTEDVERGYYHVEAVMDDAGIHPLPCPLCHGEKKLYRETVMILGWTVPLWRWVNIYEDCPICGGSGYKPALTPKLEKLLKESRSIPLR